MPVRDTSKEAYYKIKNSGLLSVLLLKHLRIFYDYPAPWTARAAHKIYVSEYQVEPNLNQFRSKITMLVDMEALEELPEKIKDPETGMRVTLYQPTGHAIKPVKKKNAALAEKKEALILAIAGLIKVTPILHPMQIVDELNAILKKVEDL